MEKQYRKLLENFFKQYTKLSYKSGAIISYGSTTSDIYYIQKGCVTASITLSTTRPPVRMQLFKQGYVFDIADLLDVKTYRYEYEALTSVTLYRAPKSGCIQLFKEYPELLTHLLRFVIDMTRKRDIRSAIMIQEEAANKVAYTLVYLAEYFGDKEDEKKTMIPLSQKELASWMGVTRETVSAQMQHLEDKKLISKTREHIIILDYQALSDLVPIEHLL